MTKYAFIDAHRAKRLESDLVAEIREIHARSRRADGCPRVVGALHQQGDG